MVAVRVVDVLEAVEVHHEQRDFRLQTLGAREFAREVHEHEARVRQARERVGERVFLRLLEHDRVVDDRGRLFGNAIEEAAMVVGVHRLIDVIDGDGADEAFVEYQRADQRRLQRGLRRHARGLEVGAWPRVDEWPPVARDPSGQPVAVANRQLLNRLGFNTCRETAAQCLRVVAVQEERAAREGDDVAELRRDEGHCVGDTEAAAHGLRDFVERVDFAMRERDVLEDVLA